MSTIEEKLKKQNYTLDCFNRYGACTLIWCIDNKQRGLFVFFHCVIVLLFVFLIQLQCVSDILATKFSVNIMKHQTNM